MAKNEVKWGAALSYLLIIVNALYGFLVTPYILSSIGEGEFGVYKTITSLSAALMVLDLGLGGTVMRYIAKYKSENLRKKIEDFISMSLGEGAIIIGIFAVVSVFIYALLPVIYSQGLTQTQLVLAKRLFAILAINMAFHIIENIFNGIITGHNKFTFANGLKLLRIVMRIALVFIVFCFVKNAYVLVLIDLVLTIGLLVAEYVYARRVLTIKVKLSFKNWDKEVFRESFKYTSLLFITTIAAQINNNLDNVVIGAIKGAAPVAIYSMALLIFGMFEQLSTSVSGVMLPTVTNILNEDDAINKVQKTIVTVGRLQFALLGAALTGFVIIGKEFINLWLGDGFEDVYVLTLILIAPAILELCVNVCLSVLRAKNMLGFRTWVLLGTTALNAVVTIVGVKLTGYYAAAVGTALSFVIGSVVIMNIYYCKKLHFNMLKIYAGIFSRIWICLLISGGALFLSSRYFTEDWLSLMVNVAVFGVTYAVTLLLFGLKKDEKQMIPFIGKFLK